MDPPASRFTVDRSTEQLLPLRLAAALRTVPPTPAAEQPDPIKLAEPVLKQAEVYSGGPVEFERVVPTSGNLAVAGKSSGSAPLELE